MTQNIKFLATLGIALLLSACSTTSLITSWNNPDITTKVSRPYIISMSKDDTHRRVFEDKAREKLARSGVSAITSYRDLDASKENDKIIIAGKAKDSGADSILIVRVIDSRIKTFVEPGRLTRQIKGPIYPDLRTDAPNSHYHDFSRYYAHSYEVIYEPPREISFKVGTVEANLYDNQTEKLLWSGQFEVVQETPFEKLVDDFLDTMTGELKNKNLI